MNPIQTKIIARFAPALLLCACFDPAEPAASDESGSSSSGSEGVGDETTGAVVDGSSGDAPGSTDGNGGSSSSGSPSTETGEPVDEPPTIDTFTINGETMLPEQERANRLDLVVEATDDQGIDRVEFFRNGAVIATDTEAPYEHSLVLASEHNGTQTFRAIAYDTAEQTDDSDEIAVSFNIDGGALLELRPDMALVHLTSRAGSFHGYPQAYFASNGELVVTATARDTDASSYQLGLLAQRFTADLSLLDSDAHYAAASATDYQFFNAPAELDTSNTLVGGLVYAGGEWSSAAFRVDHVASTAEPTTTVVFDSSPGASTPVALAPGGDLFAASAPNVLTRFAPDGSEQWDHTFAAESSIRAGTATPDGGVVVRFYGDECLGTVCIRKIAGDGSTEWTRDAGGDIFSAPVVAADGRVLVGRGSSTLDMVAYSPTGEELLTIEDSDEDFRFLSGVFSPSGSIVLVGRRAAGNDPRIASYDASGQQIWWQSSTPEGLTRFVSGGAVVTPGGQLLIVGTADNHSLGAIGGGGTAAHMWVGEYAL